MGISVSCFRSFGNIALVIPTNGDSSIQWPIPSLVYDVMVAKPGYEVLDASKYIRKGITNPLHYSTPLKGNKLYLLVPVDSRGRLRLDERAIRASLEKW